MIQPGAAEGTFKTLGGASGQRVEESVLFRNWRDGFGGHSPMDGANARQFRAPLRRAPLLAEGRARSGSASVGSARASVGESLAP
jgi:hypothetical protein